MCDLAGTNSAAEVVFGVRCVPGPAQIWQWEHRAGSGVMLAPACSTGGHWGVVGHCGRAGYLTPAAEGITGVNFKLSRMWRCLFINHRVPEV